MSKVIIAGVDKMKKNLDIVYISTIPKIRQGLATGGLIVKAQSMKNTPVQYGFTKASHRVRLSNNKTTTRQRVGIHVGGSGFPVTRNVKVAGGKTESRTRVVDYALYLHEVRAYHRVGTWKFLEKALKTKKKVVFNTLRTTGAIKFKRV